jgi:demethylmenaquinone methyltransferase/2-methoxy-6-polyprenyl-1,4-benzoquinol methylase
MSDTDPTWNDDLLRDPHHVADKRSRVQKMFAAIAPKYDLNNRLHSFGMDQRWRRKAVKLAELKADDRVVDVACGTGDLLLQLATHWWWTQRGREVYPPRDRLIGIDFTYEMLPNAIRKASWLHLPLDEDPALSTWNDWITFFNADATALPLADASADVVSIAFGIRNVQEPAKALAEFYRVLKPGGRLIILEFSQPRSRIIRFFNDLYCNRIMPTTATWISGDKSGAYKYLPMSVKTFMSRETMMGMMRDAGFVDVTQHPMTFGVAVVYRGYKR